MIVFIDDIILTGSDSTFAENLIQSLHFEFAFKDLVLCTIFLGVALHHLADGSLLLNQSKYVLDLLKKASMLDARPCSSLMDSTAHLCAYNGDDFSDPILYRSIVVRLQYATLTRLDLAFCLSKICQYMSKPKEIH